MELKKSNDTYYYTAGEGSPLYLIHGFPDCPENFEHQIQYFADQGFQVIAPYLPGYHPEDEVLDTYQTLRVSEILIEFIESLSGDKKIFLYGHDWGAPIVYGISQQRPDLISKFSAASVPHGMSFQSALLTNSEQQRKSWYMFFFQLPIADHAVPINDFEFIHRLWQDWSPDLQDYKPYSNKVISVLSKPKVLSNALAYYRSAFQESLQSDRINMKSLEFVSAKIQPPCLYLHGKNDGCINYSLSEDMNEHFEDLTIEILEDCGHFLHLEKIDQFNKLLLDFFTDT